MEGHQRAIMGQMTVEGIESNDYYFKCLKGPNLFNAHKDLRHHANIEWRQRALYNFRGWLFLFAYIQFQIRNC